MDDVGGLTLLDSHVQRRQDELAGAALTLSP